MKAVLRTFGPVWLIAIALSIVGMNCTLAAVPQSWTPASVNHTVPKVAPPSAELSFSSDPTDAEFLRTRLFSEPLTPAAKTHSAENRELARALLAYRDAVRDTGDSDAVEPLIAFLDTHPDSAWKPVLRLELGIIYRRTGHFSKALATWQAGWKESRDLRDPRGVAVANAIVAHLSQLEAYLGRKELLQPLLASIHDRTVGGTSAQLITDSHTGLYDMLNDPAESFRCGPLALKRILNYSSAKPSADSLRVLDQAHSTENGLSLSAVQGIAEKAGMHYQMAFRKPGAAVLMPAVAHWKAGHYAAIVDRLNGHYLVQDTTFGEDVRVSSATLDEEGSGYFLVPKGPLPEGWRSVSAQEGAGIWGRGDTGNSHDSGATGSNCPGSGGCTSPSVELEVVGLQLSDTPVGYTPPLGPSVHFTLVYSHRDSQQPTTGFTYSNFGPKWTFNWLSYITDTVGTNGSASLYRRGGGNEPFTFSSTTATTAYPGPYSQAILTRTVNSSGASTGFTLTNRDGSFAQFNLPGSTVGQFFMTAVGDASGNKVTLTYDSLFRIVAITDAVGEVTTISYPSSTSTVVSRITDPFGRSSSFTYTADGHLGSITDVLGITSSYTYGQGTDPDFVNTLTTPYGSTTFTFGDSSTNSSLGSTRFLKTVDPLNRTSYVEFDQGVDAGDTSGGSLINSSLMPVGMSNSCNEYMNWRNTFVFDANEYAQATQGSSLNYGLAHVIHWLHTSDGQSTSRFVESEKQPLENRVWYNYPGQPNCIYAPVSSTPSGGVATVVNGASSEPSVIGRVLDNGTTQLQTFQYNAQGNVTRIIDPVGRTTTYTYAANGIDLLSVANTTSGTQVLEKRTYNSQHRPLTITSVNGQSSRYQYNSTGELTRYTDRLGHVTTISYDSSGRAHAIQGPVAGATYSFSYDSVNRIASVTDLDGSSIHFTYDSADRITSATYPDGTYGTRAYTLLDVTSATDRLGQTTTYTYDADRELVTSTDPMGHVIQRGYNVAGELNSLTDPNGHATAVLLDLQGRLTGKVLADGTSSSITYQKSFGRVAVKTDAMGQTTAYTYNTDDTVATVSYGALQATQPVSYTYDPAYVRPTSMTDGTGTTTYSYYPIASTPGLGANRLKSMSSPVAGTGITDTVSYTYDAMDRVAGYNINGVTQTVGFDALGRVASASNPLDTFSYTYADATARVSGETSTLGPNLSMSYYTPQVDGLLQQLTATNQGATSLAQFTYNYDSDQNITGLTAATPSAQTTSYTYDPANRLSTALVGSASTPQYSYNYDAASNITSITANGSQQSFLFNSTNGITTSTYDANGSPTTSAGNTYTWDGANRLVSFTGSTNNTSTFTYDGMGRLVRVVDFVGGTVIADHSYFWCGFKRCLAHDNTQSGSPVSTQYFDQGVIVGGTSYYYVQDRLGSVRELVTGGGSVAATYNYDPYGNATALNGSVVSDIGYAGYFYHAASGLNFALFRAYDPSRGRWLNRDPFGEAGGINLYRAAESSPIGFRDSTGMFVDTTGAYARVLNSPVLQEAEELALEEEIVEGGPENPVADISALATLAIGLAMAMMDPPSDPAAAPAGNGNGNGSKPPAPPAAGCPDGDGPGGGPGPRPIDQKLQDYLSKSGGRLGNSDTRALNDWIATELENGGWNVTNGAGRGPEEWIPGPGGGTTGGTYVDITATDGTNTLRIQTVTTVPGTLTPTPAEAAAAGRITTAFPNDQLILVPK